MPLYPRSCCKGLISLAFLSLLSGCGRNDAEQFQKIGKKSMNKFLAATGGSHGRFSSTYNSVWGSLSEAALDSRVAMRLAWDRTLTDFEIQVEMINPGEVRLAGHVREPAQRQRANDLAQSTTGVRKVVNEIGVGQ